MPSTAIEQPITSNTTVTTVTAPNESHHILSTKKIPILNNDKLMHNFNIQHSPNHKLQKHLHHNHNHTQNKNMQMDPRSPLSIQLPYKAHPTDVLVIRFQNWRRIIKSIIIYFNEVASIQDEIIRQQARLSNAVQFPSLNFNNNGMDLMDSDNEDDHFDEDSVRENLASNSIPLPNNDDLFLPVGNGSISDLPGILNNYHNNAAAHASKISKELRNNVIPRLTELKEDLLVKIKEIKSLHSDFKNNCSNEITKTSHELNKFNNSIKDIYNYSSTTSTSPSSTSLSSENSIKLDPYLTKFILDRQIERQLNEENYLFNAFQNLQSSASQLEKVIMQEIQSVLFRYASLLTAKANLIFNSLIKKLDETIINKDPEFEWNNFIERNDNLISNKIKKRSMDSILYKHQFNPMTYVIRSDFLERKSKFLKSYARGFFILTPNFLHEFKSNDRNNDLTPIMSIPLMELTVTEHSKKNSSTAENQNSNKFVIHSKNSSNSIINKGHNWILKADSYEVMMLWFHDIKKLTSYTDPFEKARYVKSLIKSRQLPTSSSSATLTTLNTNFKPNVMNVNDGKVSNSSSSNTILVNKPNEFASPALNIIPNNVITTRNSLDLPRNPRKSNELLRNSNENSRKSLDLPTTSRKSTDTLKSNKRLSNSSNSISSYSIAISRSNSRSINLSETTTKNSSTSNFNLNNNSNSHLPTPDYQDENQDEDEDEDDLAKNITAIYVSTARNE
ncbi:hypothetical protein TBLA_0B05870 [Henningerozyma blattae CBS 6284]|uniref:PH domain-containing protein n=1 Tax=Henningerozyma blattae (strain ATCC 34711 / CBS 6284 / DSM 70876 / NBRC 10599 / NRRL Y-10934 / UCD 77-7) TaxID=1071380 RepID=I2GZ61_HENB6|nr:hypothetical protein TBLA_0B05870 [Tetrapisispora blattae CBS 6284]CCH59413.1 hypothetical protein TBLA_0B05870 [Tetrapisispora blattae CBS 6284]